MFLSAKDGKNCFADFVGFGGAAQVRRERIFLLQQGFDGVDDLRAPFFLTEEVEHLTDAPDGGEGIGKTFARDMEGGSTMCSFPLILNSAFKDVKSYTAKKDIEIQQAFAGSVIALKDELSESCIHAKSLLLRTAHFPLYPRLTQSQVAKIAKVLGTLP